MVRSQDELLAWEQRLQNRDSRQKRAQSDIDERLHIAFEDDLRLQVREELLQLDEADLDEYRLELNAWFQKCRCDMDKQRKCVHVLCPLCHAMFPKFHMLCNSIIQWSQLHH